MVKLKGYHIYIAMPVAHEKPGQQNAIIRELSIRAADMPMRDAAPVVVAATPAELVREPSPCPAPEPEELPLSVSSPVFVPVPAVERVTLVAHATVVVPSSNTPSEARLIICPPNVNAAPPFDNVVPSTTATGTVDSPPPPAPGNVKLSSIAVMVCDPAVMMAAGADTMLLALVPKS